MFFSYMCEI